MLIFDGYVIIDNNGFIMSSRYGCDIDWSRLEDKKFKLFDTKRKAKAFIKTNWLNGCHVVKARFIYD